MKRFIFAGAVLIFLAAGCTLTGGKAETVTLEEAKTIAVDFITNNLVQPGTQVSVNEAVEESGMYKVSINLPDQTEPIETFMTKDGKTFFPQAMNIAEVTGQNQANNQGNEAPPEVDLANIKPQAKPAVELFVMSHCPYGTQIMKGILPVLKTLGDQIDFELKFNDYAMRGELEINEHLNQYCIQKEESNKLIPYLECFLTAGDGDSCLDSTGINKSRLNTCVAATDKEFNIKANLADKNTWKSDRFPLFDVHKDDNAKYGITGSPGFVINGAKVNTGRSPQALLSTICAGFIDQPAECEVQMDSATPGAGFGYDAAGAATDASCG